MALPGLLIEYLVTGAIALLWLFPLITLGLWELPEANLSLLRDIKGSAFGLIVLAPLAYISGMAIDLFAYLLTSRTPDKSRSLKSHARRYAEADFSSSDLEDNPFSGRGESPQSRKSRASKGLIWLHIHAPELVKQIEQRSSRDRVARGAMLNALLGSLVAFFLAFKLQSEPILYIGIISICISICFWKVWAYCEFESYRFELNVGLEVREKIARDETDG